MEAAVEIGQRLDRLAGTGGRQREAQAKRRDDTLAATKLLRCATGVEQGFGKHPLELVSNHAQLSVIQRGLLALSPKQHAQEEFLMDHHKNPQEIKYLKVPTYIGHLGLHPLGQALSSALLTREPGRPTHFTTVQLQ